MENSVGVEMNRGVISKCELPILESIGSYAWIKGKNANELASIDINRTVNETHLYS